MLYGRANILENKFLSTCSSLKDFMSEICNESSSWNPHLPLICSHCYLAKNMPDFAVPFQMPVKGTCYVKNSLRFSIILPAIL